MPIGKAGSGGGDRLTPLDWNWLMGAGLGLLRLSPADFWAMTPREFGAALKAIFGEARRSEPPERDALMALMGRYPDKKDK